MNQNRGTDSLLIRITMRHSVVTTLAQVALLLCARGSRANEANFCSGRASTLHADPRDCSKFYSCLGAITFSFPCPPGLLFNDAFKVCDWPDNVKCAAVATTTRAVGGDSAAPSAEAKTADTLPLSTLPSVVTASASGPTGRLASSPVTFTPRVDSNLFGSTVSPTVSNFTKTTIGDRAFTTTAAPATTTLTTTTRTGATTLTTAGTTRPTTLISATTGPTTLTSATTGPTTLTSATTGPTTLTSATTRPTTLTSATTEPTTLTSATTGPTTLTSATTGPTNLTSATTGPTTLKAAATTGLTTLKAATTGPTTLKSATTGPTTLKSVTTTLATILTTTAASAATTLTPTTASGSNDEQSKGEDVFLPSPIYCADRKDGLYEDPEDCGGFYQCHRGYTYHFQCLRGLFFNQLYQYCDWPFNVDCVKQQRAASVHGSDSSSTAGTTLSASPQSTGGSPRGCGRIVCYVSNWSKYRPGKGRFMVGDIDPKLCTHIIYSFVKLSGNTLAPTDPADEPSEGDVGNFARVTRLKARNPKLKVLLALGGWTSSSADFSLMASSAESREEFVSKTVRFLRQRNFDGLDFDWEYPASEEEKELFALLCEKLRNAFDSEAGGDDRLLLTVAASAGKWTIDTAYNIPRISASVDFINLMSYDLRGPWDRRTGHHSPLFPGSWEQGDEDHLNVHWVANYWVSKGAPKQKLVVGAPLYARTFTLADKGDAGVGSPILGGGSPGPYTNEAGYLSYYEVCLRQEGQQRTRHAIESQNVPFMVTGNQWVGYDDTVSLRDKVWYIRHNGFGGVMVWELSQDDFSGLFCHEGRFPLLTSINDACFL